MTLKPYAIGQDTYYPVPGDPIGFRVRQWRVTAVGPDWERGTTGWLIYDRRGRRRGRRTRWACYLADGDDNTYLDHATSPAAGLAQVAAAYHTARYGDQLRPPAGGHGAERRPNGDGGASRMGRRELCRRVQAGTASYRALPPAQPDLGLGAPAIAVIAVQAADGRTSAAAWVTRPGRLRWRLAVWVSPAYAGHPPERVPGISWGIRQALQTAAARHQAALAPPAAWYGTE